MLIKEVLRGLSAGYSYERHLQAVSLACCGLGAYQQTRNGFFCFGVGKFQYQERCDVNVYEQKNLECFADNV